jgi:hypothetical protein
MDSLWSAFLVFRIFQEVRPFSGFEDPVPSGVWYIECQTPTALQTVFSIFHDAEADLSRYPEDSVEHETDHGRQMRRLNTYWELFRGAILKRATAQGLCPSWRCLLRCSNSDTFYLRTALHQLCLWRKAGIWYFVFQSA